MPGAKVVVAGAAFASSLSGADRTVVVIDGRSAEGAPDGRIDYADWLSAAPDLDPVADATGGGVRAVDLQFRHDRAAEGGAGQFGAAGVVGRGVRRLLRRRPALGEPGAGAVLPRGRRRLGVDHAHQGRPGHPVPGADGGVDAPPDRRGAGHPHRHGARGDAGADAVAGRPRRGLLCAAPTGLRRLADHRGTAEGVGRDLRLRAVPVLWAVRDHGRHHASRPGTAPAGRRPVASFGRPAGPFPA